LLKKNITIKKTARYFVLGEPTKEITRVWFVCHGYASLANYFIKKFEVLADDKTLIIAPEGFHRFYVQGFSGRIGASWMTSEDREDDIRDYITYLDDLYLEVLKALKRDQLKINVLGFSQGAATVCRWLSNGKSIADNLILWAGLFPPDLNFDVNKEIFNRMNTWMVLGDKDEFIKMTNAEEQQEVFKRNKLDYKLKKFEGKHEIVPEVLKELSRLV
jgi:predicted esterase